MVKISYKINNQIKTNYRKKTDYIYEKKTDKIKIDNFAYGRKNLEIKISPEKELITKGEYNIKGSWPEDAQVKTYYKNGWLHTGQLVDIDDEGYISINGYIEQTKKKTYNKKIPYFNSSTERNTVLLLLFIWFLLIFSAV